MFPFMRRRSKLYIFFHNVFSHILHLQKPKENIVQRQASKRLVILENNYFRELLPTTGGIHQWVSII